MASPDNTDHSSKGDGEETGEGASVLCPRCRSKMREIQEGRILIDCCDHCGGTWYDVGELEHTLEQMTVAVIEQRGTDVEPGRDVAVETNSGGHVAPVNGGTLERDSLACHGFRLTDTDLVYLKCPRCDKSMMRRNYRRCSGVMLDACPSHGVFLDAGELEMINQFLKEGGGGYADEVQREEKNLEKFRRRLDTIAEQTFRLSRWDRRRRRFAGSWWSM